jgi:hypothetical protein
LIGIWTWGDLEADVIIRSATVSGPSGGSPTTPSALLETRIVSMHRVASAIQTLGVRGVGVGFLIAALGGATFGGDFGAAPEIDAGSLLSGITLLSGGILILTNRMRRPG